MNESGHLSRTCAAASSPTARRCCTSTTFASGKRRVYATFESVKTVGGMARQIGGWVTVYPAVSRSRSRSSRGREEGVGVG